MHIIEVGTLLSGLTGKTVEGIDSNFMAIGAINLEPPRVRGPAPLKTEVLGCDGAASARVGPYAACKRPTSRPGLRDRLFKISCTRKMDCMLLLAVSPRSAKRGSSIITAASNEPPSHSIHSRDQTRRVSIVEAPCNQIWYYFILSRRRQRQFSQRIQLSSRGSASSQFAVQRGSRGRTSRRSAW